MGYKSQITTAEGAIATNDQGLMQQAKRLMLSLGWLSPTTSLEVKGGKDFGRRIEASLTEITQTDSVIRLQLRRRDAAVVMSVQHYEQMLKMKTLYADLVEKVKETEIHEQADEYERLYRTITSAESSKAADALFAATSDDLRTSYTPGRTEKQ